MQMLYTLLTETQTPGQENSLINFEDITPVVNTRPYPTDFFDILEPQYQKINDQNENVFGSLFFAYGICFLFRPEI